MNLSDRKKSSSKSNKFADFANARAMKTNTGISKLRNTKGKKKNKVSLDSSKESKTKKLIKKIAMMASLFFLFSILIGVLFLVGIVSVFSRDLPNIDDYFQKSIDEGKETVIVDRNDKELYRLQGDVIKNRVSINDVPEKLRWSFLAAEDAEFYNHQGLNLFGLSRAFLCAARNGGEAACGGGSSITQQVIKNTTELKQRSIERKAKEAVLAMKAEQEYSKDQLLELYLNAIPMGGNYAGVKTASMYMYDQEDLTKLSLAQMAYLAAITNEPAYLSPLSGATFNRERAQGRAEYVLNRMLELKDRTGVTEEEVATAKDELPKVTFKTRKVDMKAPHFVEYVLQELDNKYKDKVPEKKLGREFVRGKGYKIVTTVDLETQEIIEKHLRNEMKDGTEFTKKIGASTGAAVMMDPKSGEILAMVGSKDFFGEVVKGNNKFSPETNEADGLKNLGSTIKPINYLTTFTKGYNPSSVVPDFKLDLRAPGSTRPYEVLDYGGTQSKYGDPYTKRSDFVTMRTALKRSLNIPAVASYYMANYSNKNITYEPAIEDMYIKLSGNSTYKGKFGVPSSTIGGVSTRLIDHVHAYATLAAEGAYRPEKVILEIKDENGNIVENFRKVESRQVIEKKYTFLINDMNANYWIFRQEDFGDKSLYDLGKKGYIGGKTGTADNDKGQTSDVAFIAYTPSMTLGMWAGNSCGANQCPINLGASGEDLYKTLYKKFFDELIAKNKITTSAYYKPNEAPAGVKRVEICSMTGNVKSDKCKSGTHWEWVADNAKPEDMIQTASVVQCGEQILLASQKDKDLGLAKEESMFVYKFPIASIENQINTIKKLSVPKDTCTVERDSEKPEVRIIKPTDGEEIKGGKLKVTVFVSSDYPIEKVEIAIDGDLSKGVKLTSAPYEAEIDVSELSKKTYTLTAIATDKRGDDEGEGRDQITFKIGDGGGIKPSVTATPTKCVGPLCKVINNTPTPTAQPIATSTPEPIRWPPGRPRDDD